MNTYPPDWLSGAIPKKIKDEAGWRCVRCGHPHDTQGVIACDEYCDPARHSKRPGRMLTVHHLDGDKANVAWYNLAALCQGCHLSMQARVEMSRIWMWGHSEWFRPYVAGHVARRYGLPTNRAWVMAHYAELMGRLSAPPITPETP